MADHDPIVDIFSLITGAAAEEATASADDDVAPLVLVPALTARTDGYRPAIHAGVHHHSIWARRKGDPQHRGVGKQL